MSQTTATRPRILIINRWDDEFSQYHRYIDHQAFHVSYITTESGQQQLDAEQAEKIHIVDDILDFPSVLSAAREISAAGPFHRIIALCEFDLITAAKLRLEFGVEGPTPDIVLGWRDKTVMKDRISSAGIPVPRFARLDDRTSLAEFLERVRFPVIIKPIDGAASRDTVKLDSREAFDETAAAMGAVALNAKNLSWAISAMRMESSAMAGSRSSNHRST